MIQRILPISDSRLLFVIADSGAVGWTQGNCIARLVSTQAELELGLNTKPRRRHRGSTIKYPTQLILLNKGLTSIQFASLISLQLFDS